MLIGRLSGLAVIAGVLLAASVSFSAPRPPAGDAAAGKDVFLKKCKTCHGEDGQGNQSMAKLLKTTITPLDSEEVQSKSDAEIKQIVTEGKGKMKPVKDLSAGDIDNVIAYVRMFKKK
jgi:mono/diheme cytochrome c family protein